MLIGAVSDSHDNLTQIDKAVALLNQKNVGLVLHAGDYVSPFCSFGRVIFPLKLAMLALCPLLLFMGTAFLALEIVFTQDIVVYAVSGALVIAAATILVTVKRIRSLFSSFILHQFYLLIGLLSSFKKSVYWKTIDRSTKLELNNNEVSH
jgi:hypothetical protein